MAKYLVVYCGSGYIEAESEEEASDKFYDGEQLDCEEIDIEEIQQV